MNKKLLSALIMVLGLITLISLSSVYSSVTWQNQGQNDTYVDMGTAILLSARGVPSGWTRTAFITGISFLNEIVGVSTNMTSWDQGCCLYLAGFDSDKVYVMDTSGNSVENITLATGVIRQSGIWVNASGSPMTDFWITDRSADRLYHFASDGSFSSDPTGNFSIAPFSGDSRGVWSNVTSGTGMFFFVADGSDNRIVVFDGSGNNVQNISLGFSPKGVVSNATDAYPNDYWLGDSTQKLVHHVNSTGGEVDSFNSSEVLGIDSSGGVTMPKGQGFVSELWVGEDWYKNNKIARAQLSLLDYATLATNETGVWENKTAYGSPKDMGDASSAAWSNFTWQNTSLDCNQVVGWKIYYNDTLGKENVTDVKTFYHIPYINSTSYALSKITSATCESKHNITLTFAATPEGRVSVIMPFVYFDSTAECAYEGSEGTRITIYNESEYCWIRLNHSSLSSGDTIKIYSTKSLRVEPPPNLPAALTAAAVGLIIVIYFIVSKEEE